MFGRALPVFWSSRKHKQSIHLFVVLQSKQVGKTHRNSNNLCSRRLDDRRRRTSGGGSFKWNVCVERRGQRRRNVHKQQEVVDEKVSVLSKGAGGRRGRCMSGFRGKGLDSGKWVGSHPLIVLIGFLNSLGSPLDCHLNIRFLIWTYWNWNVLLQHFLEI